MIIWYVENRKVWLTAFQICYKKRGCYEKSSGILRQQIKPKKGGIEYV